MDGRDVWPENNGRSSSVSGIVVDKAKFDGLLLRLIESNPTTFKDAVATPKLRKDGEYKRSAKRSRG